MPRAQRDDLPLDPIDSWIATVTAEQDDAIAHREQPFETPAGHPSLATKVQEVEHETAFAACRFTAQIEFVGFACKTHNDAITNAEVNCLERNAAIRCRATGRLRIRDQGHIRAGLQIESRSLLLLDRRAVGDHLVERLCRLEAVES